MKIADIKPSQSIVKVIDFFSGVGGFSLGASRAGFRVTLAIDYDRVMTETYRKNFPKAEVLNADLSTLSTEKILRVARIAKREKFGIIAGPPCQGMSCMGKMDPADPRNRLFLKPFQFVQEAKPTFFVVETVPGILHNKYDKLRQEALSLIPSDYAVINDGEAVLVRACDCGAPTYRQRVFFAGYIPRHFSLSGINDGFGINPLQEDKYVTVGDALYGLPNVLKENCAVSCGYGHYKIRVRPKGEWDSYYRRVRAKKPIGVGNSKEVEMCKQGHVSGMTPTLHSGRVARRYKLLSQGERDRISKAIRLCKDRPGPTIRAGTGRDKGSFQAVRPIHYSEPRVITPREAARIQGFPDWFVFHDTKWHSFRQIGNSVSPIVGEKILREFFHQISN